MESVIAAESTCRPLAAADLDRVVALDAALEGRSRREYFARRLRAALREPKQHVQLAAVDGDGLAGFLLARVLRGEFGRELAALRLEAIGVRQEAKGVGIGGQLFAALLGWAKSHDIDEVRTQAAWNRHAMLRWLDGVGFELAPASIVDRAVTPHEIETGAEEAPSDVREIDYGAQPANDFQRTERDRADVRSMQPADLPDIVRIDRALTGRERAAYVSGKLDETLADSAIRVSLTARIDGTVAGYLAARTDLGDFGRVEPVAVIDTIGVDPAFAHRGAGRALLSQLLLNLSALRIERVETVVAPRDFGLLGFLYAAGFGPSQKLAFVHRHGKAS
jgi:ribosomal protein S18 acetylase RimI-like enzyme